MIRLLSDADIQQQLDRVSQAPWREALETVRLIADFITPQQLLATMEIDFERFWNKSNVDFYQYLGWWRYYNHVYFSECDESQKKIEKIIDEVEKLWNDRTNI